jgi:hypothetical protein
MFTNLKFIIALIFALLPYLANGQNKKFNNNKDTLIVYETIIVYDTIFVYDTIKLFDNVKLNKIEPKGLELNILQYDTISRRANLLIISRNQTATIPINGIILSENIKNLKSMKKLSFFGMVLFAFQSMVIAQTNIGITAGGGTWWVKSNNPFGNVEFSPTFNAGLFLKQPLSNAIYLKMEVNYTFLMNNYSYKAVVDTFNNSIGDEEAATDYHQISLPLHVGYKIGKFSPFLGVEYSYRFSESWLNKQIHSWGVIGGLNYFINDKFSVSLNYYQGFTSDYIKKGTIIDPFTKEKIGDYNYFWKSSRLGLTLYYSFNKKKGE